MGSIISTVNTIFGQRSRNILMVGPSGAGKTTILYRLKLGKVVTTIPTIGHNIETIEYKGVSFIIHDLRSGWRTTNMFCNLYLKTTDAVIFVIDSNDPISDYEIRDLMIFFQDSVLLILANKQDLPNARTTVEITQTLKLNQLPNKRWYILGTSATEDTGLKEALDWLSKELHNK